ncbi:ATP-dependent Clp protease ATP-binding subunit [Roseimaritima ulvae]|uniref:Chaperone protein ClpB n=1 Tax=Roseimaritima ulvae TaxID=980254 RepID=A0A5B9R2Q9_9BACT|nr:ATP-dependent Clp protease ATP-binding subunit [Roseimaritima ulvae]QEG40593.1 hypothetical protein UC8_26080 [Roseimaritima ulvae]
MLIITTNAGTDLVAKMCEGGTRPKMHDLKAALHEELLKTFKPAFLGRITVLPYFPLQTSVLERIARLKLDKVVSRVHQQHGAELTFSDRFDPRTGEYVSIGRHRSSEGRSGARTIHPAGIVGPSCCRETSKARPWKT